MNGQDLAETRLDMLKVFRHVWIMAGKCLDIFWTRPDYGCIDKEHVWICKEMSETY